MYSTPSIVACLFLHSSGAHDAGWGDMGAQRHEAQGAGMEGTERYTNAFILGTCLGGLIVETDLLRYIPEVVSLSFFFAE